MRVCLESANAPCSIGYVADNAEKQMGAGVMTKKFPFDKRKRLGSLSEGTVPTAQRESVTPEDPISEKQVVYVQYKGRPLSLMVTKIVEQRRSYEGRILGFLSPDAPLLKMGELKVGEIVPLDHDEIWSVQRPRLV